MKPADFAQTRCANGVFSALAVPSGPRGLEPGVRGHRCWIFKGNILWLQRGLSSDTKKQSDSLTHVFYSHSVQLRYKVGDSVSPPLCVSFNVTSVFFLKKEKKSLIPLHKIRLWQLFVSQFVGKTSQWKCLLLTATVQELRLSGSLKRREVLKICELQQDSR